jgi:ABC-type sugar transport system permease subunit
VRSRGTRRARLRLTHVDPWSVMKTAFLLSIAFGIVTVVAVAVVWSVLSAAGVWDSINKTVADVVGGDTAQTFDVKNYVGTSRVLGFTMIVAVVDVVLITAISTLGAFLYNLSAALLGGVEVTLAEDEH